MRHETSRSAECDICKRVGELRLRAEPIGRFVARAFLRSTEVDRSPVESAAAAWNIEAGAFLRREMATHARCKQCGILMGPGHIEPASAEMCGTCQIRRSSKAANDSVQVIRSSFGRRGWHSDYSPGQ